eukprot:TRINITY_DN13012_c0_g1_i1.p1 TRINITY_DN13012_c0_g1~~TRINITY_DN13012_c0_g1_i1.p1  ORF type:complete len:550 (+),score=96.70 TRINITY_DN13012_c0_g1_i1:107-1756(+)
MAARCGGQASDEAGAGGGTSCGGGGLARRAALALSLMLAGGAMASRGLGRPRRPRKTVPTALTAAPSSPQQQAQRSAAPSPPREQAPPLAASPGRGREPAAPPAPQLPADRVPTEQGAPQRPPEVRRVPWCWGDPPPPAGTEPLGAALRRGPVELDCPPVNGTRVRATLTSVTGLHGPEAPSQHPQVHVISKEFARGRRAATEGSEPPAACTGSPLTACATQGLQYRGGWRCVRKALPAGMLHGTLPRPACRRCRGRVMVAGRPRRYDEAQDPIADFLPATAACAPPRLPPGSQSGERAAACLARTTTVFVGNSNTREWLYALYELVTGRLITRETQKRACEPRCGFWLPGGGQLVYIRAEPSVFWAPQAAAAVNSSAAEQVRAAATNSYWLDEMVRLQLRPDALVLGLGLGDAASGDLAATATALHRLLCLCRRLQREGTRVYLRTIPPVRVHPGVKINPRWVPPLFSTSQRVAGMNAGIQATNRLLRERAGGMLHDEALLAQGALHTSAERCVYMDHVHAPPLMRASLRVWLAQHCPRQIYGNSSAA